MGGFADAEAKGHRFCLAASKNILGLGESDHHIMSRPQRLARDMFGDILDDNVKCIRAYDHIFRTSRRPGRFRCCVLSK